MRPDVGVPDMALSAKTGQARKAATVVDVDKLDRVRRKPSHDRIYLIDLRFCFPVLRVRPYADGTHGGRNAGFARTAFDDGECRFLCKWIRLVHRRSSSCFETCRSKPRPGSSRAMRANARRLYDLGRALRRGCRGVLRAPAS